MSNPSSRIDVVISSDAHVGETGDLVRRLPTKYRERFPVFEIDGDGNFVIKVKGKVVDGQPGSKPTEQDLLKEFRTDPSVGTNFERRMHDMAIEGVDAQVVFPNIGLACSLGTEASDYYHAWSQAYNDYVWDLFEGRFERFKPAAMLAVDDVDRTLSEAQRCIKRGFCTLFLPANVPWQPYGLAVYEPLWSLAEEAGVVLNFHVFSGNLAGGSDFAHLASVSAKRHQRAKETAKLEQKGQLGAVTGMAVGMSPIIELTGAGVLERHPQLRFIVTECESGWLAWVLQAMDQMQERLVPMRKLALKASEYFLRQGAVTIADDPVALNNVCFTGVDCLVWGNDYPHDEGTFPNSRQAIDNIRATLPPADAHAVLCGNAARLFGFDLDYLAGHREEVTHCLAKGTA